MESPFREKPGPLKGIGEGEFRLFAGGSQRLYIHRSIAKHAVEIASRIAAFRAADTTGIGNRHGVFKFSSPDSPELYIRCAYRGGLMRVVTRDLYIGAVPRVLRELRVSIDARRRGIQVAEPMGAMVEWAGPLLYRGAFLTKAIAGMTLWQFVQADDDPTVRAHVLTQTRALIEAMHDRGLYHADLNLHNLFVTRVAESFLVVLLDLDKARLYRPPLPVALRRSNLKRLARSIRKLDPEGQHFDAAALARLCSP